MSGEFDKERMLDLIDKVDLEKPGHGPMGWVYFIVCVHSGRCKIGFTKGDVHKRMKNLQTASPEPLALLVQHPGTPETERRLHERFSSNRLHGEWFFINDELRAYMVVALWSMTEFTLRQGRKLQYWMIDGVEKTLDHLETMPESLAELLEAEAT